MKDLLLTYRGRINRAKIWMALLYYIGIGVAVGVLFMILAQLLPGDVDEDGLPTFGAKSLPMIVLGLAYLVFSVWSGICVGIKRFHDRDKSGWWLLIQLVPVIGPIW